MIKQMKTTCITVGDGTTSTQTGINAEGEGIMRMYDNPEYVKPGTLMDHFPEGINPDFPDVVMLFRTTKDIDLHIKLLKDLKKAMKEEAAAKKETN